MPDLCQHLVIHGRVQGVGYRWAMVQQAEALGLRGWVRNRRDGTVEAVAAGDAAAVQALAGWARQGPPAAQVTRVEVGEAADDGELPPAFEQRPTA